VDQSDDFQKRIGLRVKELRILKGISQEAFAALCSIHRTHMSLVERGRVNLTVNTLKMIIDHLDINVSDFFKEMG
jgi:transcriptional regulator with XRE-family HTH domain